MVSGTSATINDNENLAAQINKASASSTSMLKVDPLDDLMKKMLNEAEQNQKNKQSEEVTTTKRLQAFCGAV